MAVKTVYRQEGWEIQEENGKYNLFGPSGRLWDGPFQYLKAAKMELEEQLSKKTQNSQSFLNGRAKAEKIILTNVNPDGTISADEDKRRKDLVQKASRLVTELKKEAYDIGGVFRGPGIWVEVQRALKG